MGVSIEPNIVTVQSEGLMGKSTDLVNLRHTCTFTMKSIKYHVVLK